VVVERGAVDQRQRSEARGQSGQGDLQLEPGQWRAEAEVDALAEGDVVAHVGSVRVEPVRVGEHLRGWRRRRGRRAAAGRHGDTAELHVPGHDAEHALRRRGQTEHLFGQHRCVAVGIGPYRRPLVGVGGEQQDTLGEGVGRRLVPGDEELLEDREDLGDGERPLLTSTGTGTANRRTISTRPLPIQPPIRRWTISSVSRRMGASRS
jgi:hypothetical protein